MKAIILIAGYNTRLLAVTNNTPKALLKVGKVALLERLVEKIRAVPSVDGIVLVTNSKFYPQFKEWLEEYLRRVKGGPGIVLLNDGTSTNETRRGAVGDLVFALERQKIDDDILLIACDNLFEIDLSEVCALSREQETSVVAAYFFPRLDDVRGKFGVMTVDADNRVTGFQEKPASPASTIAATAVYILRREHLAPIKELESNRDGKETNLGEVIIELLRRNKKVSCVFLSSWFDIGTPEDLERADVYFTQREGNR
ncbi:MAG: nucleotidyltransferase family protein [Chitinispirillaceae bacterium]|nr:nucleotidyltransferase family protein [Chitinispirillaceae bacterium]